MSHPLRLDNVCFKSDLMDFLIENGNGTENGSYISVLNWIKLYDMRISKNFEQLRDTMRELFKYRYVTITPTEDDGSSYMINIYGVRDDKEYKQNHKVVYNFIEKVEKDWYDNKYSFLVHNVSLMDTVRFYEDEMNHLIEMGSATKQECSELRDHINEQNLLAAAKRKF